MRNNPVHEQMSVTFAIHDSDLEAGSFRGMASVFNTLIDTWIPTRILPGAFSKTLQENVKRVKVLYQHNQDWPIGLPTKMEENGDGLLVEAKISPTTMGKDVLQLIRDGVLSELSIGFDPIKFTMIEETIESLRVQVRHISEVRLWEFSPVTFAANSRAGILSVNSLFSATRSSSDIELTPEVHALFKHVVEQLSPTTGVFDLCLFMIAAATEQFEGKMLSAKNKQLVMDVVDALNKLLKAAEPSKDDESKTLTAIEERLRALNLSYVDALRV